MDDDEFYEDDYYSWPYEGPDDVDYDEDLYPYGGIDD